MPRPGHQQPHLVRLPKAREVADGGPEFAGRHIELLHRAAEIGRDAAHDALQSVITAGLIEAGDAIQKLLHGRAVGQVDGHRVPPSGARPACVVLPETVRRRAGQPRSPPATGNVTPVM